MAEVRQVVEVELAFTPSIGFEIARSCLRSGGFWVGFALGPWVTIAIMFAAGSLA